jgi:DNA polymerase-3 subunit beta
LSEVIRRVSFAASREESRPILNGVLWQRGRTSTRLVATNGHRLAYVERTIDPELGADGDYIVPPKALEQVAKLFPHDDRIALGVSESGNHLAFRSDTTCVTTRVIEGPYPDYRQVIPTTKAYSVLVDTAALTSAVRRCIPVVSTQTYRLAVTFDAGLIQLAVTTPDVGDFNDEVAARIETKEGIPITFGVNAAYLLDLLGVVGTETVMIEATTPESAIVLRPQDEQATQSSLFLIMPLRLLD